jgi:hypothetical protein
MDTALSLILRPLIALGFFLLVALIAWPIKRRVARMRSPRLRSFLLQPVNVVPRTEEERRSWWPVFWWVALALVIWVPIIVCARVYHW